jgi:glycogen operon protein
LLFHRWQHFFSFPSAKARLSEGAPTPLGATWDGRGTNFALFSAHAAKVELCLFDKQGRHETERIALPERTEDVWHGYLSDVVPGQLYGYRVHGPYEPERGFRFNNHKLLVDPYAKRLSGGLTWTDAHFAYRTGHPKADLSFDRRDNARGMPKAIVIDEAFTWGEEHRPVVSWEDSIFYEAHVKGLTKLREDVPPGWRGTFRGLTAPSMIDHLKRLGVTTLELLPIHAFIDDRVLVERGLVNYWGYNTLCFFAPELRYAADDPLDQFRATVSRLHDAGIEVVLDVVYNHTAEGNHMGPTLSFRGIDNTSYYWLQPDKPRYYDDFTGTGNSLNLTHPRVLQMVMDSLRYWVEVCHVDGFRFDLASTLGRGPNGFDRGAAFFAAIRQDPVLSSAKLVAEPWDIGMGGYQVGAFPTGWSEWNDHFRRTLRRYWAGEGSLIGDLARRMTASADLFDHDDRSPRASINHITVHDGFSLADLVSYEHKHNEANGEDNRDGSDDNYSINCGVEGPTADEGIRALRQQLRRNLLASLMLAQGVPLMLAGDEVGNSRGGNNNVYCQDNETGWVDWSNLGHAGEDMIALVAQLTELRRKFPQLRPRHWVEGRRPDGSFGVIWLTPHDTEMTPNDWNFPDGHFHSYVLAPLEAGQPYLYILLNAAPEPIEHLFPALPDGKHWKAELDTTRDINDSETFAPGVKREAPARSVLAFSSTA